MTQKQYLEEVWSKWKCLYPLHVVRWLNRRQSYSTNAVADGIYYTRGRMHTAKRRKKRVSLRS